MHTHTTNITHFIYIHTHNETGSWGLHQTMTIRPTMMTRRNAQRTTNKGRLDETKNETRNSHRLNLTSALIYTGRDHKLIGKWGREEELTIKRMENT